MYIAYNLLLIDLCLPLHWFLVSDKKKEKNLLDFVFTLTPLLMIDKKGEKYLRVFDIYACFPCFIHKGGEGFMFMHICFVLQIGEKEFDLF